MENRAPHAGKLELRGKPAQLDYLEALTKSSKIKKTECTTQLRELLQNGDWEVQCHALKAVKKTGVAAKCADLLVLCIDCVHAVPVRQQTIYERALQAAIKDAGNAMAPHMEAILQQSLRAMPSTHDDDAFAQQLTTSSASRMVLSVAAAELTEAQAAYAFAKVEDECSDVRIAALEVCSTAMSRFAREPHVDAILRATRDEAARCVGGLSLAWDLTWFWPNVRL